MKFLFILLLLMIGIVLVVCRKKIKRYLDIKITEIFQDNNEKSIMKVAIIITLMILYIIAGLSLIFIKN
jgi:hypothetical protein